MPFLIPLRLAAPYIAVVLFLTGVWAHGYHTADKHRVEREAQITAQSNLLIAQAKQHNADIQAQAAQSAQIIGETYDANQKTIGNLTANNRDLLNRLRQQSARRCPGGVSDTAPTTEPSDAAITGAGGVLEGAINSASIADEVTETARACQAYVNNLQEVFNETRH